jgi:hypothetical protein
MRTKALLIAAAALAVGVMTSQAQVYSQNIVGYVNQPVPQGYNNLDLPLDLSAGNTLTNIFINTVNPTSGSGPYDGATVYSWNGSAYTIYTLDSGQPTGVGDAQDFHPVASPTINSGTLIYLNNNTGVSLTNTIVGTVHVDGVATGAQTVGTTTNNLPQGYSFVSSKLPIGGGITTVLQLTNPVSVATGSGPLDGATVYFPQINAAGSFLGYTIVTFDSGQPTGFGDAQDFHPVAEPVVPVGTGFIFNNNTGVALEWTQSL